MGIVNPILINNLLQRNDWLDKESRNIEAIKKVLLEFWAERPC
jgi:hypothetical protein